MKHQQFKKSSTRKSKTKQSTERTLKTVISLFFIFPLILILFILDRVLLLPLLGINSPSFQFWYDNTKMMAQSVIRVGIGYGLIGLVYLVVWLVSNFVI